MNNFIVDKNQFSFETYKFNSINMNHVYRFQLIITNQQQSITFHFINNDHYTFIYENEARAKEAYNKLIKLNAVKI